MEGGFTRRQWPRLGRSDAGKLLRAMVELVSSFMAKYIEGPQLLLLDAAQRKPQVEQLEAKLKQSQTEFHGLYNQFLGLEKKISDESPFCDFDMALACELFILYEAALDDLFQVFLMIKNSLESQSSDNMGASITLLSSIWENSPSTLNEDITIAENQLMKSFKPLSDEMN